MTTVAMEDSKQDPYFAQPAVDEVPESGPGEVSEKFGTTWDQRDMSRMGKKQELRREFQFISITGYAMILGCSWEFAMVNVVLSLPNGGKAGTIYMAIVVICGMLFTTLSMAEMASMAPTSGGQYHWCSEFASRKWQKFLSYNVGYQTALGWQTSLAAVCWASAQQITALATLNNPNFSATSWQTCLIAWGILALAIFCNTVLFRRLPLIEGTVAFLHVLGFFAIIIVLWIMAPLGTSKDVFTSFESNWSSVGFACLIGVNGPVAYLTGADASVHLSEELRNASWVLPRSMIATALTNYVTSFVILVTLMFGLGNIADVENSATGQPYIAVILNATKSTAATSVLTVVVLVLVTSCCVNGVTTSSRQLWSFARDGGTPFSGWLSQIRPGWDIPMNAMLVSMMFTVILTLIAVGSTVAYNIFVSLNISGLLTSYIICITCILTKRLRGEPFPASRFNLGKWGNVINIIALCFLSVFWVFQFIPTEPNPPLADMNWSSVIWSFVVIFFMGYYAIWGRRTYTGPVVHVKKDL